MNTADLANDRHLILDALARYAWGFDEADFELLADAFTEDASTGGKVSRTDIEWGPLFGRAQIVEVLASIRRGQTDQRRHSLSTARFHSQSEDAADVSVYITVFGSEQLKTRVVTTGWYRAEFARQADGAWRMKKLDAQLDAPF